MKSTKNRNYLLATIFTTLIIIGIFAYRYYEERKRVEVIVDLMMSTDALDSYNKYIESGMSKDSLGDFKGAIEDYYQAKIIILEDGSNFSAYQLSGLSKTALKDYKDAIIDFDGAIRIDSSESNSYYFRGFCKTALKDYKDAIIDFNDAIRLDSSVSNSYLYRGLCKAKLNDKNGACLDWSKAQELGNADAHKQIKKFCN
jgi:tetratricopeptide (TPR) repeat protein